MQQRKCVAGNAHTNEFPPISDMYVHQTNTHKKKYIYFTTTMYYGITPEQGRELLVIQFGLVIVKI